MAEVLGLPPDDDRDPSDEQQQQHSHCSEHGVSREHMSGPLGQDQAQDDQQETPPVPGSRVKGEVHPFVLPTWKKRILYSKAWQKHRSKIELFQKYWQVKSF